MPATIVVVGPFSLANQLAGEMNELKPEEIEADIRSDPDMYYPEYVALCDALKTEHLSEDAWYDLCRS